MKSAIENLDCLFFFTSFWIDFKFLLYFRLFLLPLYISQTMDLTNRFPKYKAYPPVPNWYSSNVTAIVEPHFFLYATRNLVVILGLTDLKYFNSFAASSDKLQAIAAHETFCYTAGVDSIVRGWNILLGSLFTSHEEHKVSEKEILAVEKISLICFTDRSVL
jgi:hypothetical protein